MSVASDVALERLTVSAYRVPTDQPESDGTLEWDATTMVLVRAEAGAETGLGYTYADASAGALIESMLSDAVRDCDPMWPQSAWAAMWRAVRNSGQPGLAAMAISAVDVALWDLKAKLLGVCLADLLPRFHEDAPIYGSGGFTSYSDERLAEQLSGWVDDGIPRVKIKVGREPSRDPHRLEVARHAIGHDVELYVDANGAFTPKEALRWADRYASDHGVSYFEEPVSSEDRAGMGFVRERGPAGMAIAAGEYGWTLPELEDLAGSVDVLQADVTRCGGITNMLRVDGICKARGIPFSAHCAPAVSAHVCCAIEQLAHIEYFHDHVRIERMLFEGTLDPSGGALRPDRSRPGLGIELKRADAERWAS
jgi:L-alanine-DL-glutamate epimerase-like enolase superfamily enzyme